jgi:hypothetical protein
MYFARPKIRNDNKAASHPSILKWHHFFIHGMWRFVWSVNSSSASVQRMGTATWLGLSMLRIRLHCQTIPPSCAAADSSSVADFYILISGQFAALIFPFVATSGFDFTLFFSNTKSGNKIRKQIIWKCVIRQVFGNDSNKTKFDSGGNQEEIERFEVFTTVTMKDGVFWVVTPCGCYKNWPFGGTWRLLHQGDKNRWTRNNTNCN